MMKHKIYAVAAAGAIALSLAACGGNSGSGNAAAGGSTASSADTPTVKLMVGGIDKQIYLPYQLAEQLGYYKKYGVNVELSTEQQGGVGAEDAMASGQVDMTGAWYIHTVDFQSKGKNVINLVQLSGAPGERLMCATNSGIHSAADLKGKTVGVTDLGSGTDELTQFIASKAGLSKNDYHTIAVGAGATAIAAIQRGSADCVMTTQPTVGALESKNLAYTAVDLATADGAKAALGGEAPAAGLLAQADWVKTHEDAAQKVVNALVATMQWINSHSAAEIADKLPASYVQNNTISKDQYVSALNQDKGQFLPDGIMPAGGPKVIFEMEKTIGVDTSKVTISNTFTNKYALAANKLEGYTPTTTAAGDNG
ncbi:NitT/TauT family transport system substrate-binding protein [Arthrobacter sp. ok909]|jgi:NitT/TauT family transport system substrate-binding protein|uniref:ABC transporter substrate-binding protein n=1 Tax=Arthrobacter sp. ok909 TaxID=1761746 RepID=UPI000881FA23|nr:ABC transporter substrate-binding protein [Arthrobacter sp. ok909]SDP09146.1 NitT/TauT family transport system substrate-binding protein [Arthrobacter sp. ok909]